MVTFRDFHGYIDANVDATGPYFTLYLEDVGHIFIEPMHSGALGITVVKALLRAIIG